MNYSSYRLNSSSITQTHIPDLIELSELAGIHIPHNILRILIELLEFDLHPYAVKNLLRDIFRSKAAVHKRKPVNV